MSSVKRLVSGVAASCTRIAIHFLSQILIIPIFLREWDSVTFGVWLTMQTIVALSQTLDQSHQMFMEAEFLKYGFDRGPRFSALIANGCATAFALALLQVTVILILIYSGTCHWLTVRMNLDGEFSQTVSTFLLLSSFSWLLFESVAGVLIKSVAPLGYAPRMAWWGVAVTAVLFAATSLVAFLGGSLADVAITQVAGNVVLYIFIIMDLLRILRAEGISIVPPSFRCCVINVMKSFIILLQSVSILLRGHGVRLLLLPFMGSTGITVFTTTRTAANVAIQGLGTLTGPLIPELMRFANQKNQPRVEAVFATVWLLVMVVLVPGLLFAQFFGETVFSFWTKGKVEFDPLLFALFSMSIIVFAVTQPASALIKANNLLGAQLAISCITSLVVLAAMFLFVRMHGLRGAAIALLLAEAASITMTVLVASRWMSGSKLSWPSKSFALVVLYTTSAVSLLLVMSLCKAQMNWLVIVLAFSLFLFLCLYVRSLPSFAKAKLVKLLLRR